MADVTLTAELRANVDNLQRNVASAVTTVQTGARSINTSVNAANASLTRIVPGANSATQSLTNLGRVAQDAPFGFIGIANNLNPLLEGFQRLRAETGSNGAALRALGGSLMGAGGIGLALSAFTAVMTFAQMGFRAWTGATKKASEAAKEYAETLGGLRQAELKGAQNAAEQTTRLNILYNATTNSTLSLKERNAAYDELSSKYPKFFSNSERESTLLGKNISSYNELATAILTAAQAKAYEDRITQNTSRQLEDREKLLDATKEEIKQRKALNNLGTLSKNQTPTVGSALGGDAFAQIARASQSKLNDILKRKADILTDIAVLEKRNGELSVAATTAESTANFKTGQELDDKVKKLKAVKKEYTEIYGLDLTGKDIVSSSNIKEAIREATSLAAALAGTDSGYAGPIIGQDQATLDNLTKSVQLMKDNEAATSNSKKATAEYNAELAKEAAIGNDLVNVFGGSLTSAFESVITGGQSLASAMASVFLKLVAQILAAVAAAAILVALLSLTGLGSVAKGFGGFSGIFGQLSGLKSFTVPGHAEGGITTRAHLAMVGEGGEPEVIAPLSKLEGMMSNRNQGMQDGQIVGVLRGSDLVLQYDRALKQRGRTS